MASYSALCPIIQNDARKSSEWKYGLEYTRFAITNICFVQFYGKFFSANGLKYAMNGANGFPQAEKLSIKYCLAAP